jgi:GTPase SAR1 family protein
VELNKTDEFKNALEWMKKSEDHVFVTGKAGTGKSTLLEYFRDNTDDELAVLAPTGVAAVNVRGQTIHSFFGFRPDITVEKVRREFADLDDEVYENLETIKIDEISMVRADLLDCVDTFLRLNGPEEGEPFGGVKMIFVGDPFQLEPVQGSDESEYFEEEYDSPWFFDSHVFEEIDCRMIELSTVHRQADSEFVDILNSIRTRTISEEQLERLNEQVDEEYEPSSDEFSVYLTPTNKPAREINQRRLDEIDTPVQYFEADMTGEFEESRAPTRTRLPLKPGAQVMMLNNDSMGRWVNGSMGRVLEPGTRDGDPSVEVELERGEIVTVTPYEWEMVDYEYDAESGQLVSTSLGTFKQIPMDLSWAVTIHKSQGKTLDRVILDTRKASMFAHGQAYVALSRCTSLDGLVLKEPLREKDVWMDYRVTNFFKEYHLRQEDSMPKDEVIERLKTAIKTGPDVEIVYVNSRGEKSRRTIRPHEVGTFSYRGNAYEGVDAYSYKHEERRQYTLERIARVHPVPESAET